MVVTDRKEKKRKEKKEGAQQEGDSREGQTGLPQPQEPFLPLSTFSIVL